MTTPSTDAPAAGSPAGATVASFSGYRLARGKRITVSFADGHSEDLRHVIRHSPTGMDWGYAGSGLADLALSIVTAVAPDHAVPRVYQAVKEALIAPLPPNLDWQIQATTVLDVIARVLGGEPQALAGLALSPTQPPSRQAAKSEAVERILEEVDHQLFLEEYVTLPGANQLTERGRNAVREVVETALRAAAKAAEPGGR